MVPGSSCCILASTHTHCTVIFCRDTIIMFRRIVINTVPACHNTPYDDKHVADARHESQNPDAVLESIVCHQILTRRELVRGRVTSTKIVLLYFTVTKSHLFLKNNIRYLTILTHGFQTQLLPMLKFNTIFNFGLLTYASDN